MTLIKNGTSERLSDIYNKIHSFDNQNTLISLFLFLLIFGAFVLLFIQLWNFNKEKKQGKVNINVGAYQANFVLFVIILSFFMCIGYFASTYFVNKSRAEAFVAKHYHVSKPSEFIIDINAFEGRIDTLKQISNHCQFRDSNMRDRKNYSGLRCRDYDGSDDNINDIQRKVNAEILGVENDFKKYMSRK